MKLVFFIDDYAGGAGKIVQILALEAIKQDHTVTIVLARRRSVPRYDLLSIQTRDLLPDGRPAEKNLFKGIPAIRHIVAEEKPDVVISFIHNINIMVGLALIGTRTPLIVSERCDPVQLQLAFPWTIFQTMAYARANVVSVLFDTFRTFKGGRFIDKCLTTPNPVLTPPCTIEPQPCRSQGPFTFITMSRLTPTKRVDLMIQLFAKIHQQYPATRLVIVGDGKERQKLTDLVAALGLEAAVLFRGDSKAIYEELYQADAYLMTSRHEGFPNALVEAVSVGLPSVSFSCHEGLRELIQSGVNGFLIPEGRTDDYVKAMEKLVTDRVVYRSLSLRARELVDHYGIDRVYAIWQQCFEQLTAQAVPVKNHAK